MRKNVSIDTGIKQVTRFANRCYIRSNCLVINDCQMNEGVVFAPGVIYADTCSFGKFSQMEENAVLLQGRKVAAFAMVGMNATVTSDVPNFALSFSSPSRTGGVSRIGLERFRVLDSNI